MTADQSRRDKFRDFAGHAMRFAETGKINSALASYEYANLINPYGGSLGSYVALLRHSIGDIVGDYVEAVPPTEDGVISFYLPYPTIEALAPAGLEKTEVPSDLASNIKSCVDTFDPAYHAENIREDREHVMFLSTGRVGTVSLLHLFSDTNFMPYHTYWWHYATPMMWLMMTALLKGGGWDDAGNTWAVCRAAEWLGPKPMMGLNHFDTIFAPVFASLHKRAKFVYLKRNPEDSFKSMHCKEQFQDNQLRSLYVDLGECFTFYRDQEMTTPERIAWFLKFTDTFCKAFGSVVSPERYIEIEVEKLWAKDEDEIKKLLSFTGSDVTVETAVKHFETKINEKKHKDVVPLEPGLTEFRKAWHDKHSPS